MPVGGKTTGKTGPKLRRRAFGDLAGAKHEPHTSGTCRSGQGMADAMDIGIRRKIQSVQIRPVEGIAPVILGKRLPIKLPETVHMQRTLLLGKTKPLPGLHTAQDPGRRRA